MRFYFDEGQSDQVADIARRQFGLDVGHTTDRGAAGMVGQHVDNIDGKIGVHERGKARRYAQEHGLTICESAIGTIDVNR